MTADIEVNAAPRRRMRLVAWRVVKTGSLRRSATVELPIGLRLIDCPVFLESNGPWASPPSRPLLDREGKHIQLGGKGQYTPIIEWRDRGLADRFSEAVVGLVRQADPGALDPDGEPQ